MVLTHVRAWVVSALATSCCNAGCRQWADFPWLCAVACVCAPPHRGACKELFARLCAATLTRYKTIPNIWAWRTLFFSHYACLHGMYAFMPCVFPMHTCMHMIDNDVYPMYITEDSNSAGVLFAFSLLHAAQLPRDPPLSRTMATCG